jgi:hypothetical protein
MQVLPDDVLKIICSYERMAFMYVNKKLHAEYIKYDTQVYRDCVVKISDNHYRLNLMLVWYEFAEYKNKKLYRYISRSMWPEMRNELAVIYDRAVRLKWNSYYYRARSLNWTKYEK